MVFLIAIILILKTQISRPLERHGGVLQLLQLTHPNQHSTDTECIRVSAVHVWMCQERWSLNLWGRVHKRVTPSVSVHVWEWKGREDACVSALVQVHSCLCAGWSVCVCVRVCGPALHCAGGQNTRDCFDLDSLCLVQSQSCHRLPTAGATHSWCREETLLHVITLCTLYFTPTMFTKWLHLYPTEASQ